MTDATLYIGNKAYSSWSLRGWLALRLAGLPFKEVTIPMGLPDTSTRMGAISPTAKVPCLHHGAIKVWESIAICEYAAEIAATPLWPADRAARAHARAISAEMHAGFLELRKAMWMNLRQRFPGRGRTEGALADIARLEALWRDTRRQFGAGGPYLFGAFTLADAMFMPTASRLVTWEPVIAADTGAYVKAMWDHPLMREWRQGAAAEPWTIDKYENPGP